jgi:hypothetical protein
MADPKTPAFTITRPTPPHGTGPLTMTANQATWDLLHEILARDAAPTADAPPTPDTPKA